MVTSVLLVDDDIDFLDITKILMQQSSSNLEVVLTNSVKEALQKLEKERFDIIISDYLMPDSTGLDLLEALRASGDDIGFILWTGHSTEEVAIKALNLGADHYILKGPDMKEQFKSLQSTISKVLARKNACSSNLIQQEAASEFIHKLSHDVIGVLQNIMGYTTLLNDEFDKSYLDGIARLTKKLNERLTSAVSTVDGGELNIKK